MSNKLTAEQVQILKSHLDEVKSVDGKATFSQIYSTCKSFANSFERILKSLNLGSSTTEIKNDGSITKLADAPAKKKEGKTKKAKKAGKKETAKKSSKSGKSKAKTAKPKKVEETEASNDDVGVIPDEADESEDSDDTEE